MLMENKAVNADQIHLKNFQIFKWEISASEAFADQPSPIIDTNVRAFGEYVVSDEEKLFGIRIHLNITSYGEEEEELEVKGDFSIEFHFEVEDLTDYLEYQGEGKALVSDQLLGTLLGIAYSTSRGLVYDRLHGSFLEGTILPVLNPLTLIQEDSE